MQSWKKAISEHYYTDIVHMFLEVKLLKGPRSNIYQTITGTKTSNTKLGLSLAGYTQHKPTTFKLFVFISTFKFMKNNYQK